MDSEIILSTNEVAEWYSAAISLLSDEGYDYSYLLTLNTSY